MPTAPPSLLSPPDLPLLLACSPRPGGNTDTAARLFGAAFAEGAGESAPPAEPPQILFLRDFSVSPCIGCGNCDAAAARQAKKGLSLPLLPEELAGRGERGLVPPFGCPLARKDDGAELLLRLLTAPMLCLFAPIYFYHLPAVLKALIDRTQPFWSLTGTGVFAKPKGRGLPFRTVLVGARKQGEKLFEGSMLTLRYALGPLGRHGEEPLLLYGLDARHDLENNAEASRAVAEYGREAGREFARARQS